MCQTAIIEHTILLLLMIKLISFIYRTHHDMNYKSLSQVTAESE